MERMGRLLKQYGLLIVTAVFFIAVFLISRTVPLYGDDFAYKQFTTGDFNYYISRHIQHYFLANGRVIVHILATLFLALPRYCWALFNGLMLSCIVFFGAETAGGMQREKRFQPFWSGLILSAAIFFLSPDITRQSVYWLTGSFNYVYPAAMLFIYWYLIDRPVYGRRTKWLIPVLALLASATTEQTSLMTAGLTVLIVLDRTVFKKQKLEAVLLIALAVSFLGTASILLSPSIAYRASMEDAPVAGFWNLIRYNLKDQGTTFLFSKMMLPYHLLAMLSALGTIFEAGRKFASKASPIAGKIVMGAGASAFVCWIWQVTARDAGNNYAIIEPRKAVFYFFIGSMYLITLLYASVLAWKTRGSSVQLIAVILCIGSQLMMVVSPVYGPRTLLSAIFMLALYAASLLPDLHNSRAMPILSGIACFLFNLPWLAFFPAFFYLMEWGGQEQKNLLKGNAVRTKAAGAVFVYILLLLISGNTYLHTLKGYNENAWVYQRNLEAAQNFSAGVSGKELIQYELPHGEYGWVMPYHNAYYDPYYKLYLGIDEKTKIIWQKP